LDALIQQKIISALKYYEESGFKKIEKIRILRLIRQFIEIDKLRGAFTVLSTEEKIKTNIAGLEFTTRLDRLDEMSNGDKIIFDYKTGKSIVSHWCGQTIKEPQLPIYAISKDTQGIADAHRGQDRLAALLATFELLSIDVSRIIKLRDLLNVIDVEILDKSDIGAAIKAEKRRIIDLFLDTA
jgi:hypothetical protein